MTKQFSRPLSVSLAFVMTGSLLACGSDDSGTANSTNSGTCPRKITIQSDWFPELEHGGIYQLIGPNGTVDKDAISYVGKIQAEYAVDGLEEIEILTKNFDQANSSVLLSGKVDMAFIGVADIIKDSAAIPLVAVAKTLDKDPLMIMWDPTQFDIQNPTDLASSNASFIHFPGLAYIDYFIEKGYLTSEQSDPTYNGSDAAWVAKSGAILQQGFATNEIYKYENDIPWKDGSPADVSFFTVGQLGLDNYPSALTMLRQHADELDSCLKLLIPKISQAWVDFYEQPQPVTDKMIDINREYDGFWQLSTGLNSFGLDLLEQLEIGANSPDGTYCSFDEDKITTLYEILKPIYDKQGVTITDDLSAVYNNDYCVGAPGR